MPQYDPRSPRHLTSLTRRPPHDPTALAAAAALVLLVAACSVGGVSPPSSESSTVRLYTSVTQDTVDAIVAGYRA